MIGTIAIRDLRVSCIVGIHARERELPQVLRLDVELDHDLAAAERTEDVAYTVDYAEVSDLLAAWIQEQKFRLLETLVVRACDLLLQRYPGVVRARVTVKKPGAVPLADHAAVTGEKVRPPE